MGQQLFPGFLKSLEEIDTGVMAASILILLEEMDTWGNGCFQELNKKNPGNSWKKFDTRRNGCFQVFLNLEEIDISGNGCFQELKKSWKKLKLWSQFLPGF